MAWLRATACVALVLLGLGCARPDRPWVDRLEVDAFEGGEIISLSGAQLERMLGDKLVGARFEVARPGRRVPDGVKPWRLQLAAGLDEPDLEAHTSSVVLALELQHAGEAEPFALDSRVLVKAPSTNDVEAMQLAIRDALEGALGAAVQEAEAVITGEGASDERLVAQLGDASAARAGAAVRLLVRRRHRAALPALLARLKTDDLHALRGVIGLLVELRAPESVNPIVEAANQRGPVFQREVVFAVGAIGGEDAEAYLDLVASGHDDPLLRASAAQALQELRARQVRAPRGDAR